MIDSAGIQLAGANLDSESIQVLVAFIMLKELIMNSKILSVALPVVFAMGISGGATPALAQGYDDRPTFVQVKNYGDGYDYGHRRHRNRRHRHRYDHNYYGYRRSYGDSYYPRHAFRPYRFYYEPESYFPSRRYRRGC